MRIDRFLHCIRLVKSRTLAQSLIDAGHVRLDGRRVVKSSAPVHPGQIIALPLRGMVRVLRIRALHQRRGPAGETLEHYEELGGPADD